MREREEQMSIRTSRHLSIFWRYVMLLEDRTLYCRLYHSRFFSIRKMIFGIISHLLMKPMSSRTNKDLKKNFTLFCSPGCWLDCRCLRLCLCRDCCRVGVPQGDWWQSLPILHPFVRTRWVYSIHRFHLPGYRYMHVEKHGWRWRRWYESALSDEGVREGWLRQQCLHERQSAQRLCSPRKCSEI